MKGINLKSIAGLGDLGPFMTLEKASVVLPAVAGNWKTATMSVREICSRVMAEAADVKLKPVRAGSIAETIPEMLRRVDEVLTPDILDEISEIATAYWTANNDDNAPRRLFKYCIQREYPAIAAFLDARYTEDAAKYRRLDITLARQLYKEKPSV